jgi:hypothetical protein
VNAWSLRAERAVTFDEAVLILRGSGLTVEVGPGSRLSAAADPDEPSQKTRDQRVNAVYGFAFSLYEIDSVWFLRVEPLKPSEEYATLDAAIQRALVTFDEYRQGRSAKQFGDQFALFEAAEPCTVVEAAFVSAGWLGSQAHLAELGLSYVGGCSFDAAFPEQRRLVRVSLSRRSGGSWRLVVRCYRAASAGRDAPPMAARNYSLDGTPLEDALAPGLAYKVALAVHRALVPVASGLRWNAHGDPDAVSSHDAPVPPSPAY